MPGPLRNLLALPLLSLALAMPLYAGPASGDATAVAAVLDDFHDAADKGDKARYLGHFTEDGVFLGTDDWERWPLPVFRDYVEKRFQGGKGWSYRAVERHVRVAEDGGTAWFDEIVESAKWGRFRGTGVLLKRDGQWKVAHYALSFLIPNAVGEEVSRLAQAAEKAVEKKEEQQAPAE